ncbi:MAG TPA: rhodanese-like domain-containing protein [Terriglobales bacterium]|nr:rhodanese-like domain-containing protein [Terriglobales bacterium]
MYTHKSAKMMELTVCAVAMMFMAGSVAAQSETKPTKSEKAAMAATPQAAKAEKATTQKAAKDEKQKAGKDNKTTTSGPKVRSEMLVSTDWVAQHWNDPNVIIVHVGGERADYEAGHIGGARHLPTSAFVANVPPGSELPAVEELKKTFDALGIDDSKRVILYANDWFPTGARAYFTLDYLGHGDRVALMDGGLEKWLMEKKPLSTETPTFAKTDFQVRLNKEILATREQVKSLIGKATMIDARPQARYHLGHIPGASPMFWEKNLVSDLNPVLSVPNDLRKKLVAAGLTTNKQTVAYCETGWQSSFAYFVAKYMGYNVINYDGSFSDWRTAKEPIEKGAASTK